MNAAEKQQLSIQFAMLMSKEFQIYPLEYPTLASFGQALMKHTGCFNDVPALAGVVCDFIRRCQAPILLGPAKGEKVRVEGDIVQIDRRGSYCAAYHDFQGIPRGAPITIRRDLETYDYFYILVSVVSFSPKQDDPFPLLKETGRMYMDKNLFDAIGRSYNWQWEFICGYGFEEGFNCTIQDVAAKLWRIRSELKEKGSPLQGVIKRLINSLWGKAIARDRLTYARVVAAEEIGDFVRRNSEFIFKLHKCDETYKVQLVKPVVFSFRRPQFGVNVLSWSRLVMQDIIRQAVSNGLMIYYSNTDCLVMKREEAEKLNEFIGGLIGKDLGQFDYEFPQKATKFICLSARKYLFRFEDGTMKVRYSGDKQEPELWFEWKYLRD
jgi:hypothetical protein